MIRKVDDEGDIQLIDADGLADEQHTKIMRVYPHGFSSNSPEESHMLALGLGGRRDLLVALGGEHPKY
ncbi:phage baseplate assembly protein, partial [Stenotrophomonas maltophilia]|uniref:phage baseplate assembly protein n=1 Tax=Stenotrophomonas maltophilia TaxID=40324 RepID=UPI003D188170